MAREEPPPLYRPELIEPKKRLSLLQKCYKEPWVPIGAPPRRDVCVPTSPLTLCRLARPATGALTTVAVLCVGFGAFIVGDKRLMQTMMRARVASQGITVVAMGVSSGLLLVNKDEENPEASK